MRKYQRARKRVQRDKQRKQMRAIYKELGIENMNVVTFMNRFHSSENISEVFTNGCCFWFAKILHDRFALTHGAAIMYDEVANHFGTRIDSRVYDITGDVTHKYNWSPWENMADNLLRARIIRDCIMF